MALKQPPYRPPPQVFGPVWTVLYGLMGYSAYRAWDTGMSSLNPNVVALTKVQNPLPLYHELPANTSSLIARSNSLHHPARPQPRLDATLFPPQAPYRSYSGYRCLDGCYGIPDLCLVRGRYCRCVGPRALSGLVGICYVPERWHRLS